MGQGPGPWVPGPGPWVPGPGPWVPGPGPWIPVPRGPAPMGQGPGPWIPVPRGPAPMGLALGPALWAQKITKITISEKHVFRKVVFRKNKGPKGPTIGPFMGPWGAQGAQGGPP